ncbi:hypothetical protein SAMN05216474_1404 [Lishizhenia tianjinensis]|uniref:Uncharacterized protein n=1 Tax=Lishizhenia tianjinensis TaxID=477690 RepID=A0A1I6ZJ25_9FLAO|nr:hypothetical protein SAMN05216474_1404 [Lishizhenia tianjinensis]
MEYWAGSMNEIIMFLQNEAVVFYESRRILRDSGLTCGDAFRC